MPSCLAGSQLLNDVALGIACFFALIHGIPCVHSFFKLEWVENSFLLKWVENSVEKGEIARYEQFLLFPQCFQKTYIADT